MIVALICAYVSDAPALRCSGPFVSFINTAILTGSGSRVVFAAL